MTMLSPSTKYNILRTAWSCKYKLLALVLSSMNFMYMTVFVIPVRNYLLYPVMEDYAWRSVETPVFVRLRHREETGRGEMLSNITCKVFYKPSLNKSDVNISGVLTYEHLQVPEVKRLVLKQGHGRFLPTLNTSQKIEILYLYKVAAAALDSVGGEHFLVSGTLLGLSRHKGFVPWDDDVDIAVSLDSWKRIEETLSCIQGFTLYKLETFHWKFRYINLTYPFLDIFFYRMDESYVWAATHYIRTTFIYPMRLVFPLGESIFEGMKVPVPRFGLDISRRIYEYDVCLVHQGHIQRNMSLLDGYPEGYSLTKSPCKDLAYMYTFLNM